MKLTHAMTSLVYAAAAITAWGHPGHGAEGATHHFVDLLALAGIATILAVLWAGRKIGGKEHD
jgi:uncharacterized membrane protein YphA (DoxX/SURF4 family)